MPLFLESFLELGMLNQRSGAFVSSRNLLVVPKIQDIWMEAFASQPQYLASFELYSPYAFFFGVKKEQMSNIKRGNKRGLLVFSYSVL